MKDTDDQPVKKAGASLFLTRFSEAIDQVYWLNSNYLIFNSGDKIKVAEIDERDKINIYNLAEFKDLEFFWNYINKRIYVLSDGNFYQSGVVLK